LLAALGLGYLVFVCLWGYDLGFPLDYDLMFSMGILLQLALTGWVIETCLGSKALTAAIVSVNLLYSWVTMSLLLR
jgi:hypothetical protein